jgi:hypothetical protein
MCRAVINVVVVVVIAVVIVVAELKSNDAKVRILDMYEK